MDDEEFETMKRVMLLDLEAKRLGVESNKRIRHTWAIMLIMVVVSAGVVVMLAE